jgi:hypothetical protein
MMGIIPRSVAGAGGETRLGRIFRHWFLGPVKGVISRHNPRRRSIRKHGNLGPTYEHFFTIYSLKAANGMPLSTAIRVNQQQ